MTIRGVSDSPPPSISPHKGEEGGKHRPSIWHHALLTMALAFLVTPAFAQSLPYHADPSAREILPGATPVAAIRFLTTADFPPFNYRDEATGIMRENGSAGAFAEVTLHPRVEVADAGMADAALAAHRTANEWCFIANSVNFPVHHEPTIVVAGG